MKKLFRSFLPISLSDLVMTAGDPMIALYLATLPNATQSLAAFGLAKAVSVFFESPVIAILNSGTALSNSGIAIRLLKKFSIVAGIALSLLLILITLLVRTFWSGSFSLSQETVLMACSFSLILGFWPFFIATRRCQQGILIGHGHNQKVARGAFLRLGIIAALLGFSTLFSAQSWLLAPFAIMAGLMGEWIYIQIAVRRVVLPEGNAAHAPATMAETVRYYLPLGASMTGLWGSRLLVIMFLSSIDEFAVAAWTSAWALIVSISNGVRMVQQVVISHYKQVRFRELSLFTISTGMLFSFVLILLSSTVPGIRLLNFYLSSDGELIPVVRNVILVCSPLPFLMAMHAGLQGFLMTESRTKSVGLLSLISNAGLVTGVALTGFFGLLSPLWIAIFNVLAVATEVIFLSAVSARSFSGNFSMKGVRNDF